jgi:hypothetical protein
MGVDRNLPALRRRLSFLEHDLYGLTLQADSQRFGANQGDSTGREQQIERIQQEIEEINFVFDKLLVGAVWPGKYVIVFAVAISLSLIVSAVALINVFTR